MTNIATELKKLIRQLQNDSPVFHVEATCCSDNRQVTATNLTFDQAREFTKLLRSDGKWWLTTIGSK